ncbi:MAG: LruC domain-containing protein, partial [Desulfobacteraceae bacterium]
ELVSTTLTDSIRQGEGNIDLLKDIAAADLEAYRVDGENKLFFAVDINENASGTEKATTQGVTIKSAELAVTIGGDVKEFTTYSTETKAVVTENTGDAGTLPQTYYTLLGGSGSNRITGSKAIIDQYDSILTISDVNESLAGATDAKLIITLLDTDPSLGDPEAFYDFNNGFEDMAIFIKVDAEELTEVAAGRDEAPTVELTNPPPDTSGIIVSWIDFPSSNGYYWIAYEDLFPEKGDYDFNDLVVPYKVRFGLNDQSQVLAITGTAYLLARGASYDHDWHLRISLPATASGSIQSTVSFPSGSTADPIQNEEPFEQTIDLIGFSATSEIFVDPEAIYVNTLTDRPFFTGPKLDFRADMTSPIDLADMDAAPFDPYLVVNTTALNGKKYEIHLIGKSPVMAEESRNISEDISSFTDEKGYPFALLIPENWQFPTEWVDLGVAYPDFIDFVLSQGSESLDWYLFPATGYVKDYSESDWLWTEEI